MKEQWVTQDDIRVCPICQPLDGAIFQEGEGPQPPLHEHCRCVRIPINAYDLTPARAIPWPPAADGRKGEDA